MGFAGAVLAGAIWSFVMTFVAIGKYLHWKKVGIPGVGVIGNQIGAPGQRNGYLDYLFDFTIELPDRKIKKIYKKTVSKNKPCCIKQGDRISILWDDKDASYEETARLKKHLTEYPMACLICTVVFIICTFISAVIEAAQKTNSFLRVGISAAILCGCTFWIANRLCKKWDHRKSTSKEVMPSKAKRGTAFYVTGTVLVIIQLLSIIGNAKNGSFPSLRFDSLGLFLGDLVYLIGYFFVGILGGAFIFIGNRIHNEYKTARSNKIQNAYYTPPEKTQSPDAEPNVPAPAAIPVSRIPSAQDPIWDPGEVAPLIRRYFSVSLSLAAFIVVFIAMNYQDATRNEMERVNTSLIYLLFLVLFGLYFAVIHYSKRTSSEKPQAAYAILLSLAVFVALHEGSVFSNGYFESGRYTVYSHMDILSALNIAWSAIPFILLIINQPGFVELLLRAGRSIKLRALTKFPWKAVIIAAIAIIACQSIYLLGQSNPKQPDSGAYTVPGDSAASADPTDPPLIKQDTPKNGHIFEYPAGSMVAPLTIKTSGTNDYYVALKHVTTTSKDMAFYVRGGATVDVDVPLGEYEIYYASGLTWYGEDALFGPDGSYYKCENTFPFTISANAYDGWTLTLSPVADGNLDTEEIDLDEFPN